jgi:subtilisin
MTELPAWSEAFTDPGAVTRLPLPEPAREWAWGGSTGLGVKVAIIDSGVDAQHPAVGPLAAAVAVEVDETAPDGVRVVEDDRGDLVGHGTACAGIIRGLAPDVTLYSVRVLGANLKGRGSAFHAGVRWALEQGITVLNLSLSSKSEQWFAPFHELTDEAYFSNAVLVCAANNMPGPTYPSQFASVLSVAAVPGDEPELLRYNTRPPVEFGARGIDVRVPWNDGKTIVATGNSFATPHVTGMVARILAKHPGLTPFQVKGVLHAIADNPEA